MLKRNTQYWRAGYPRVDAVEYRLGVDANTQLQQVQADQLDIMGNDIPSGAYTAVSGDPAYKDQFVRESLVATNFLVMDSSQPDGGPLSNVKVRQAIAKAIDKDNLLLLNNGRGTKAGCIYPPQLTSFDAACDPYPRDVEGAKALLAEAGFKDGFSTTLYTDTQDLSKTMSESMIQDLADIGIKVELVQQDFDVLIGTITTPHAAPMVYIGWFQDFPDPSDFYDPILSCAVNVPGGASYGLVLQRGGRHARGAGPRRGRHGQADTAVPAARGDGDGRRPVRAAVQPGHGDPRVQEGRRQPVPSRLLHRSRRGRRFRVTDRSPSSRRLGRPVRLRVPRNPHRTGSARLVADGIHR